MELAAEKGYINLISSFTQISKCKELLHQKNEVSKQGLLHIATENRHISIVKYLLGLQVDPNSKDIAEKTPLHYAVACGDLELVETLLPVTNYNIPDQDGKTPLHLAVENRHISIAKYLLEFGADLNQRDAAGKTALHYAAHNKHDGIFEYLISKGADPDIRDKDGQCSFRVYS